MTTNPTDRYERAAKQIEPYVHGLHFADLLKLLRAHFPVREEQRWISIETAPLDGSPVMIGWWEGKEWHQRRAWWQFDFESDYDHESDTHSFKGAWTDNSVVSFGYEETAEYKPTHWQPLPASPMPSGEEPGKGGTNVE